MSMILKIAKSTLVVLGALGLATGAFSCLLYTSDAADE